MATKTDQVTEIETDRGTFALGESVWVSGWPKSKAATYRVHRLRPVPDGIDVQLSYEHRGTRQIHSVRPERLGKRRDRRQA
jgi:hypothetical protein